MQKFVVKKISRSTNITLGTTDDTSTPYCEGPEQIEEDLDTTETSVRMCGYLKKKRNVRKCFKNYCAFGDFFSYPLPARGRMEKNVLCSTK